jgi:N4-(beta-N-acetylglucosaminyl)-L-asparaginase
MKRRIFVARALAVSAAAGIQDARSAEPNAGFKAGEIPLIVSTWPFGKPANDAALKVLSGGGSILDAVEQGIWVTESGEGNRSVGLGGLPNAAGIVQLDACIMSGPGHQAGSVAAIEGIRHPISAARRVMEKTRHVMLVGECARMFAIDEGLEAIDANSTAAHEAWRKKREWANKVPKDEKPKTHDTIALLVLGPDGNIAGGCSTSGLSGKLPGRVGDSPIIGSGLYVDNDIGAAGATGIGENVMRYCGSFMVVEFMRQGMHPQEACLETIRRIARKDPKGTDLSINFVALDKKGRHGAAGSGEGFKFAVTTKSNSGVLAAPGVGRPDAAPKDGNPKSSSR